MCRYNMNVAKDPVGFEYGWTKAMIGDMVGYWAIAYAAGQFVNGQVADKLGGRKMMAVGALITAGANIAFGLAGAVGSLTLFTVIWMVSGWGQSMGAPSFVKINSCWFGLSERGVFTGIFGICTQLGSALALSMTGFIVAAMHWRWAFYTPAIIALAYGAALFVMVRDRPEPEGYPSVDTGDREAADDKPPGLGFTLRKVFTSKPILIVSFGYFCLGVVRYGLFVWYPSYLREVHHISTDSPTFQTVSVIIPFAGMAGALMAGYVSDSIFRARRAPVAALMYLGQAAMMVVFYFIAGPVISGVLFVFLAFFVNGPHSLLGGAASMDFGGRKAAASAAGIIDAFQYLGMFLITTVGGRVIQAYGWDGWIVALIVAAAVGAGLLALLWNVTPGGRPQTPGSVGSRTAQQGAA
jgi:OPA family glycerol-3-phosphate transporter-like MFS transporter